MLRICAEHLTDDAEHQSVAVLGIALVVLGEDVGTEVSLIFTYCLCITLCIQLDQDHHNMPTTKLILP